MCLIIYKPKEKNIKDSDLINSFKANSDSYGIMWAEDGKLNIIKGIGDFDEFYTHLKKIDNSPNIVIHLRTSTTGGDLLSGAHPILINENLAFVHNGNLFEFSQYFGKGYKSNISDTQRFNEDILQKLPDGFLNYKEIVNIIEEYIKNNFSKIVLMDSYGNVIIFNEESGIWEDGIWFSNGGIKNYGGFGFSGLNYYKEGQIRHKGGLMNVQLFKDKGWKMCNICMGYYKDLSKDICRDCRIFLRLKDKIDIKQEGSGNYSM